MSRDGLKIVIRGCHNLAQYRTLVREHNPRFSGNIDFGLLPCSGKIEPHQLLKFFEHGADGTLVLACPKGACRFVEGNLRAARRAAYAAGWLEKLGLEPERILFRHIDPEAPETVSDIIRDFQETVAKLGPTGVAGG